MVRLLAFGASMLVTVALLGLFTWRIDPLGDYYDRGATAAAQDAGCLLSDDVVGVQSWWDFKRDLFGRRKPETVVVGTSRVLRIRSEGDRAFANIGLPGTALPMLPQFFSDLQEIDARPRTVYLGIELFWVNENWSPPYSYEPPGHEPPLRNLLTRQRVGKAVSLAARRPLIVVDPWYRDEIGGSCVIDRAGRAADGDVNVWAPDGSMVDLPELRPDVARKPPENDFDRDLGNLQGQYFGAYYGNWDRLGHLRFLEDALARARSYGWDVVGFTPPYSPRYVRRLETAPETAPRWREYGTVLPALFRRHGFRFVETRSARALGCAPGDFTDDGWHADESCSARLLSTLERAAS